MREVKDNEGGGVEERGRNGVGELVVWKTQSFEGGEKSQFGGNVTAEVLVRERELGNSVAGAGDAGPVACSGVVFRPGAENGGGVGVDGGFEGEEGEAV